MTAAGSVPEDDAWYYTPEVQASMAASAADVAAGRVTRFASDDEFLAALAARD